MKSFMASPATIERKWYVVDATGYTLVRLTSEVAKILRGKNKPIYTPHIDCGDYVIVTNASKIKVTGKKLDQKIYYSHSDYVGGMKETTLREMLEKKPEKVIELAVKGMLPKGPLGRSMITKLHVYAGPDHEQAAQKPEVLPLKMLFRPSVHREWEDSAALAAETPEMISLKCPTDLIPVRCSRLQATTADRKCLRVLIRNKCLKDLTKRMVTDETAVQSPILIKTSSFSYKPPLKGQRHRNFLPVPLFF